MKIARALDEIICEQAEDASRTVWLRACTDGFVEIIVHEYDKKNETHEECSVVLKNEDEVEKFIKNIRMLFYKAQNEQTENGC